MSTDLTCEAAAREAAVMAAEGWDDPFPGVALGARPTGLLG